VPAFPGLSPMATISFFVEAERAGRLARSGALGEAARGAAALTARCAQEGVSRSEPPVPRFPWRSNLFLSVSFGQPEVIQNGLLGISSAHHENFGGKIWFVPLNFELAASASSAIPAQASSAEKTSLSDALRLCNRGHL
jgi:hypothetical protein